MGINTTYEQDLAKARELLQIALESNDADDAWALVDFLRDQKVLELCNMHK